MRAGTVLVESRETSKQTLGLTGATLVGVGAIVGGGILALAGVAFATTGPGAIAAFTLNGAIALITALSFAEMSSRFPQSGGSYVFAKKVMTVQAAFAVGWVVWVASIVAGVLYALGFASYVVFMLEQLWSATGRTPPAWLHTRGTVILLAVAATAFYSFGLMRRSTGGGRWETVAKMLVFAVLIVGGLIALWGRPLSVMRNGMTPFFPNGGQGLFQAMGYTFIALQGFDLVAAVGGEVKNPVRTIPRAMILSLALALGVYVPLLFIIATVGVPSGASITQLGADHPETVVAVAAQNFLGPVGLWLVSVGAILAMLSALQANLFAASRVAMAMAYDRTLPNVLDRLHPTRGTPVTAVIATSITLILILLTTPDIATVGAAASLIFLLSFALAHWTNILARQRSGGGPAPFRVPWFPLIPLVGGFACVALAMFQAVAVPAAGAIVGAWLGFGAVLYALLFARRARIVDAWAEAADPHLVRLRGRNPLVLVPIANPSSAASLVEVANAMAPQSIGRVLLLSVVSNVNEFERGELPPPLRNAQDVLGHSLAASFSRGLSAEALVTIANEPSIDIARVAAIHHCESLLLGFGKLGEDAIGTTVEDLMGRVDCDVVCLRAPQQWQLSSVNRVLVPLGGKGRHDELRARLLGALRRTAAREIKYLRVLPEDASTDRLTAARRGLNRIAQDEARGGCDIVVEQHGDAAAPIVKEAAASDLVILGLRRASRRQKSLGDLVLRILRETSCAVILISRRG